MPLPIDTLQVVDAMEEESASIKQVLAHFCLLRFLQKILFDPTVQSVLGHFKGRSAPMTSPPRTRGG
jgi:hypothetical protein